MARKKQTKKPKNKPTPLRLVPDEPYIPIEVPKSLAEFFQERATEGKGRLVGDDIARIIDVFFLKEFLADHINPRQLGLATIAQERFELATAFLKGLRNAEGYSVHAQFGPYVVFCDTEPPQNTQIFMRSKMTQEQGKKKTYNKPKAVVPIKVSKALNALIEEFAKDEGVKTSELPVMLDEMFELCLITPFLQNNVAASQIANTPTFEGRVSLAISFMRASRGEKGYSLESQGNALPTVLVQSEKLAEISKAMGEKKDTKRTDN